MVGGPYLTVNLSTIATGLNLFTFQGVVATAGSIVVTTLDSCLVRVLPGGKTETLADLSQYGIPFGITEAAGNLVVVISAEESGDVLVRVAPDGRVLGVVDLSAICGSFGAPFGVAVAKESYAVTIATDVSASTGCLVKVTAAGAVTIMADLSVNGIPFDVTAFNGGFVVAQEKGSLVKVATDGTVSSLVNLAEAGYGIPFGVAVSRGNLIVTTNAGHLLEVSPTGAVTAIANVTADGLGIPSGIAVCDRRYLVTTTTGNLLAVTPA